MQKRNRTQSPVKQRETSDDGSGQNFIDYIPIDLLLLIFSLLPEPGDRCRCSAVSKKWFRLQALMRRSDFRAALSHPATREISRYIDGSDANDLKLAAMAIGIDAFGVLTDLSVMESLHLPRHITDLGLKIMSQACSKLKSITLANCIGVSDQGIAAVANNCSALKNLQLTHASSITDRSLIHVATRCSGLESLILTECVTITDQSMLAIAAHSTRIKFFELYHCPLITDYGIVSVITSQTRLERLKFSLMKLGDSVLHAVSCHGNRIKLLSLDNVYGLSAVGYSWMGEARDLQILHLAYCTEMGDGCIRRSSPFSYAALKKVTIRSCSSFRDASLCALTELATLLENLHLEGFIGFTYRGLVLALRNCSRTLKVLKLVRCNFRGEHDDGREGEAALRLPMHCPTMRTVKLVGCVGIGDDFIAWIGKACRGVTSVRVVRVDSITDRGITSFMKHLHGHNKISRLDLSGCVQLGNRSVWSVTRECKHRLRHLNLNGCERVSDRGAQVITRRCANLVDLDLGGCNISDVTVQKLVQEDPQELEVLSLAGCTRITDQSLEALDEHDGIGLLRLNLTGCSGLSPARVDFIKIYIDQVDF
ncbi:EIN3-binding F-box protein 1-like [Canna indica]|uniref:EIN3-binding F-box protein 1-like n=1 Tax=Canna indica TaxID=4628 RepID=A0AAQ3JSE2_9LILI|nr:EIN3-binding F-box protein 1-like [Canna indica]